ncbi:MAG: DUF502 domain-containing protein [Endomicrobiales bacterium]
MSSIKKTFKRYFITGLVAIFPLWLTLFIIWLLFRWISSFAVPFLSPLFSLVFGYTEGGFIVRLISFVLTIGAIWCTGFLTTHILGRRVLQGLESIFTKMPLMSGIYVSARKLIQYLFTQKRDFKRVVMVEFPKEGSYSVGFVTGTNDLVRGRGNYLNVFVPTTPNPTTGFLLFTKEEAVIPLEISVDEAVRLIISGGIIVPGKNEEKKGEGAGAAVPGTTILGRAETGS